MSTYIPSTMYRAAAAALLLLGAAACSDAPSAPRSPSAAPAFAASAGDTAVSTFTYTPGAALTQGFSGGHLLTMPTNAVCDPATSGYGADTWDQACAPLQRSISFTARTWTDAAGRPHVTFSPDVRFVPGAVVTLRLKDKYASITEGSAILWCPTGASACVNEAATDASLLTYRDPGSSFVYRRLKHFSGYNVVVDRSGNEQY